MGGKKPYCHVLEREKKYFKNIILDFFPPPLPLPLSCLPHLGNVFLTLVALSDMRLCRLQQEVITDSTGFGGHVALSHSGILWFKTRATSKAQGQRDVMNTLGPRGLRMYSQLSTPKVIWTQWCCFGCCEDGSECSYCMNTYFCPSLFM